MSKKHHAKPATKPPEIKPETETKPDPLDQLDALLADDSPPADHPDGAAMAEVQKILDDAPIPEEPKVDERPVGEIKELPPEGEGKPAFRTLPVDDLKGFAPPEPLPDLAGTESNTRPNVSLPPATILSSEQSSRMGAGDPNVVHTSPQVPPAAPSLDHLPEKTRQELEAGRRAVGSKKSLAEALAADTPVNPTSNVSQSPAEVETEKEPDWSKLPERTRRELEAGREALRRKDADYRAVVQKVAAADRERLEAGAPADPGDLTYSEKR